MCKVELSRLIKITGVKKRALENLDGTSLQTGVSLLFNKKKKQSSQLFNLKS